VLEVTFWSPGTDLGLILQPGEGPSESCGGRALFK